MALIYAGNPQLCVIQSGQCWQHLDGLNEWKKYLDDLLTNQNATQSSKQDLWASNLEQGA